MSNTFSDSIRNVMAVASGNTAPQGQGHFPSQKFLREDCTFSEKEQTKAWFEKCVKKIGDLDTIQLHDRIAFFGHLEWDEGGIKHFSFQSLCLTEGTLNEVLSEVNPLHESKMHYYRFDFDFKKSGKIFCEALPHIHCRAEGPARFPFQMHSFPRTRKLSPCDRVSIHGRKYSSFVG